MKTPTPPTIGDIQLLQQSRGTICALTCKGSKPSALKCVLLDEMGRSIWEQTLFQQTAQSTIEMRLPKLKSGNYNFWIEVEGKTHLRQLRITPRERRSLLGKWVNLFA